jgi:hypothetical protein
VLGQRQVLDALDWRLFHAQNWWLVLDARSRRLRRRKKRFFWLDWQLLVFVHDGRRLLSVPDHWLILVLSGLCLVLARNQWLLFLLNRQLLVFVLVLRGFLPELDQLLALDVLDWRLALMPGQWLILVALGRRLTVRVHGERRRLLQLSRHLFSHLYSRRLVLLTFTALGQRLLVVLDRSIVPLGQLNRRFRRGLGLSNRWRTFRFGFLFIPLSAQDQRWLLCRRLGLDFPSHICVECLATGALIVLCSVFSCRIFCHRLVGECGRQTTRGKRFCHRRLAAHDGCLVHG